MNTSIVRRVLGWLLALEGAFMLLPFVVGLIYREDNTWYFLGVGLAAVLLGLALAYKKAVSTVFYMREGCIATALGWIELSFFGCLPFYLSGEIPRFTDAMFETVSGFTTTGASILSDVESLSHCMGAALPTGWAAWACWSFCWPWSSCPAAPT